MRLLFPLIFCLLSHDYPTYVLSRTELPDGLFSYPNPNFNGMPLSGKFWYILWPFMVYYIVIWYIVLPFGVLYCHLVYFIVIWCTLLPFGVLYCHLVYFIVIWYILLSFGIFYWHWVYFCDPSAFFVIFWYIFPALVCCAKKNLATLC
jgi:hypothetical protein